ncbi:MAG TPA: ABC transporter permease subunit [Bacteroidota bacterium]|nr:ABC transporter permease subunit [Bacteroidota bacterium]
MKILTLLRWTIRELAARATLYVLAGISTFMLLFAALAIGADTAAEGMTITFFGRPASPPVTHEALADLAGKLEAGFAGGLFLGVVVFGVFGTAGVITDALEKGTVDLYLSKPIARWQLLLGKYLGSVSVMFLNIVYFIGGLWLIVGVKVGVWNARFLLSALLLTYVFAGLYAVVAFFGVVSRNVAIAIIAGILYVIVIAGPLEGRQTGLYLLSENAVYRGILDGLYYLFPQIPAMESGAIRMISGEGLQATPFVQSFFSAGGILALAAWLLHRKDF